MKESRDMNRETVDASTLPPRRVRHPKPKSMIDNPRLPFVVFLAFITILGVIFFSYYYASKPAQQDAGQQAGTENGLAENETGMNGAASGPSSSADAGKTGTPAGNGDGRNEDENEHQEEGNPNEVTGSGQREGVQGDNRQDGNGMANGNPPAEPEPAESTVTPPAGSDREARKTQPAEPQRVIRYTVQPGDTLFSIAMKFYGSQDGIRLIQKENRISGNTIYAGMKLRIPNPKRTP